MKRLRQTISVIDKAFDYAIKSPPFLAALIGMTILVLNVPVAYVIYLGLHLNDARSALLFPNLPAASNLLLITHIAAAIPSVAIGPFMFVARLREDHPALHRKLGKAYVIGCLISAVTVFPLAVTHHSGPVAHTGFGAMALIWFGLTWWAYTAARRRDLTAHRRWMMRSYAMTFAFVHVNLTYRFLLPYSDLTPEVIKIFQSMVSWLVNLLIVEIYLAATTHTGRFLGWEKFTKNLCRYSRLDRFYFRSKAHKTSVQPR